MERLLETLNPQQRDAVAITDGPLLIVAGAGTGKTHALTVRAAHLIRAGHAAPENLLAITFTNRAAASMRERLRRMLGDEALAERLTIGTFHAVSLGFLREYTDRWDPVLRKPVDGAAAPPFSIADEAQEVELLRTILRDDGLPQRPDKILEQVLEAKERLFFQPVLPGTESETEALALRLIEEMSRERLLDFDDLLLSTCAMLQALPEITEAVRARYRHILVDEYQDVDSLQIHWLKLVAGPSPNLCVIGDPDQAIYAFRGAHVANIVNFPETYPKCRVVKLELNYRNTETILSAAEALIANNRMRIPKTLWTEREAGERIRVLETADEGAEAGLVVYEVESLMGGASLASFDSGRVSSTDADRTLGFGDFAVLYRINALAGPLEKAFHRAGIPCQVVRGTRFFDRPEIRDVMAYMRFLANPDDTSSFLQMLNVPRRGLGDRTAEAIVRHGRTRATPPLAALEDLIASAFLPRTAIEPARRFLELTQECREAAAREPASGLLAFVHERSGLAGALAEDPSAKDRVESIRRLEAVAARYDRFEPAESLRRFLGEASLAGGTDDFDRRADAVHLMSFHAAKGLEFPVVFACGLEEGLVPLDRGDAEEADLEEERRLFYVALTRACDRLYLLRARERLLYGQRKATRPSPFLHELPADSIDRTVPEDLIRFTRPRRAKKKDTAPGQLTLFDV